MISGFQVRSIDNGYIVSWVEQGSQGDDEPHEQAVTNSLDLNKLVEELLRRMRTL